MATFKSSKSIFVSTALLIFLGGCVAAPPQTSTDMAAPPAPKSQPLEQEQQPRTAPTWKTQQNNYPSQAPSRQSVFGRKEPAQTKRVPINYADIEFVQQRLTEYQTKLDQWLEISETDQESKLAENLSKQGIECVQLLERILTGYSLLLERMQQNETVPVDKITTVDPKRMQQIDISFLESRCDEVLTMDTPPVQQEFPSGEELQYSFTDAQKIIISQVNNGNYQEALLGYSHLSQDYPEQKPAIFTQLNYGLALQYSGQVGAAARHFSKMLASGDLSIEPLSLQLEIADLLLASGNISAAESYYESFILAQKSIEAEKSWAMEQLAFLRSIDPGSREMLAYTKLMREFQTYDYRIHSVALNKKINAFVAEHGNSPVAESGLRLKTFTIEQLNSWFGRQLVKIDYLVAEKRFTEAADILKDMTHYYLPADMQAIVQKTYYEVAQAEVQETENQERIEEMELTQQWDTAVNLMDSQNFDEAIFAFEALTGTEYEEKATIKIVETSNLAAKQIRKEAAALFSRAVKTPDFEIKKELLLDSHKMLNEILIRYPQTDLVDKVHQNIAILEEQIRKFDPALLEELQKENYSAMPDESPDPFYR